MKNFICVQCGTQFEATAEPPARCPICEDERQFVRHDGQAWTTLDELRAGHRNKFQDEAPKLTGIGTEPEFAIGQRALLLQSPRGNLLWDCVTLLDDETVEQVNRRGGIRAIAISHPHYYSAMVEWAETFDAQIFLHTEDRQWVMRNSPFIEFWKGETLSFWDNITLVRCGGHFEGGTVLHWPAGAAGKGALLSGDILQVVQDRRYLSFMRSFPNYIPLGRTSVERIVKAVEPFAFEEIYGAWWKANVLSDAKGAVHRSADRYIRAISS
jgi:glyoxylase-like metal-dependent hydrolase (beta-lactamase superfamily II)